MSEERAGEEPGERDDLDELLDHEDDEGGLPSEGEDLELDEESGEESSEEPPQPSRTQQRRAARQTELRELRELREEKRRLWEMVPRSAPQYQQPQIDPARQAQLDREERERVAQMPFDEQGRYWADKRTQELNQRIALAELRTADMLDRQEFKQIMRERRLPPRYATEVDNLLAQARQNGMNPSREDVLYRVIGRETVENRDRETERARKRGQRRIASQTVRPSGTRSTAANAGGRRNQNQDAEDEALLRGITVGEFDALNRG